MNSAISTMEKLLERREQLKQEMAQLKDMRPGTLIPRFRKCGKPNCHCAKAGAKLHGPSYSLTRRGTKGKTVTTIIPESAVEEVRQQIDEHKRFRRLCKELVEANVQVCDEKLEQGKTGATAKKGGSKKPSQCKSPQKSKH